MSRMNWIFFVLLVSNAAISCVPKTQYDDQQAKLEEAQSKLKSMENNTAECDKDVFIQLREQSQSLELLNQELLDRNSQLSKEISRLKVIESQVKSEDQSCQIKQSQFNKEWEEKLSRTRTTYEDLIRELKAENAKLKEMTERSKDSATKKPSKSK